MLASTTTFDGRPRLGVERWAAIAVFLAMATAATPLVALVPGNEGGLFVVEDAEAQFDALKHHAEALAWLNPENLGAPDPSIFDHYQGLARNPRTGVPVFYVSQLDDDDGGTAGGYLHVVSFGSRPTTGERLRSNLQQLGNDTEEASPPAGDTWIRSIRFDGTPVFDGVALPVYKHPGSMALVDDVLFVPVDQPTSGSAPIGQILLFDVSSDATNPVPLQALVLTHGIDNLAVTRLDDGTYRLWTNGDGGEDVNVYDTTHADLRDGDLDLTLVQIWDPTTDLTGTTDWPTGSGAHQGSAFLREADGDLYLIGMRHPGGLPFAGSDFADLYFVDETGGQLALEYLATKQFNCVYDGGGGPLDMRVCNMTAANNAYVSPTGELILYSIPHDDEDGFDPDIVRMGEFRHRDVNRPGSPLRSPSADAMGPYVVNEGASVALSGTGEPPADRPWVELYDDTAFADRSIVVDFDDRHLLELSELDALDDFTDKTSSLRWRSPPGLSIELFDDDDFSDRNIALRGTGATQSISNVQSQVVVTGVVEHFDPFKDDGEELEFGDKTSSLRWVGSPPAFADPTLDWDLDDDDVFGEAGAAAERGGETGATPTFDAADIDGPAQVTVTLRASVAGVATVGTDTATIQILNLPPTVAIDSLDGGLPGLGLIGIPVVLEGSFSDVAADTHSAEVDWDDGAVTPETVDGVARTVTATHVYIIGGAFDVELAVTDDDLDTGTASAPIVILDAAGALEEVLDAIDDLLQQPLSEDDLDALGDARDHIDGNNGGKANNGALDKLEAENRNAALIKIEAALAALDEVEGTDVSTIEILLALAARSIAETARAEAVAAIGPTPTPAQQRKLDEADTWLADGVAKMAAAQYAAASSSFRFAVLRLP